MNTIVGYTFSHALAQAGSVRAIGELIRSILKTDYLWLQIEPHLVAPGLCGCRRFDQANAVIKVREWDKSHGNSLATSDLNDSELWKLIYREISRVYLVEDGWIIGVKKKKPDNQEIEFSENAEA